MFVFLFVKRHETSRVNWRFSFHETPHKTKLETASDPTFQNVLQSWHGPGESLLGPSSMVTARGRSLRATILQILGSPRANVVTVVLYYFSETRKKKIKTKIYTRHFVFEADASAVVFSRCSIFYRRNTVTRVSVPAFCSVFVSSRSDSARNVTVTGPHNETHESSGGVLTVGSRALLCRIPTRAYLTGMPKRFSRPTSEFWERKRRLCPQPGVVCIRQHECSKTVFRIEWFFFFFSIHSDGVLRIRERRDLSHDYKWFESLVFGRDIFLSTGRKIIWKSVWSNLIEFRKNCLVRWQLSQIIQVFFCE